MAEEYRLVCVMVSFSETPTFHRDKPVVKLWLVVDAGVEILVHSAVCSLAVRHEEV